MPFNQEIPFRKKFKCQCGETVHEIDCDEPRVYCPYCGRTIRKNKDCKDFVNENTTLLGH